MFSGRSIAGVLASLLFLLGGLPASAQSLNEVLGTVSQKVKEFQDLLPDFVCNERVTSTEFDSGKMRKERVVDSIFTGVQRSNNENEVRFAFAESREVMAIDGKPARKGTPFPKLPYRFAGGFSSLLNMTFAPDNLQYHDYSMGDRYKSDSEDSFLVRFATKEGQQNLRTVFQGEQLLAKDVGAAWIDLKSFRVLRLQRQSLNLPQGFTRSIATADYGSVTIDEKQFWMPTKIRAEVTGNSGTTVSYMAEYSDCRKFTADTKILP
jgi:hypothetical protein